MLILATKLYIPPPRPELVRRPRLIERLDEGLHRKLTLVSAPAGFGKTTLISEWLASCQQPVAWLSLDHEDNDPARFMSYFVAALQTIAPHIGLLQSPQPPPIESILTALLNDIAAIEDDFVFVLDDYHVIDTGAVDAALTFLLDHLPPQMHLVIATREDPMLPLARLRARDQLTELRVTDLRFTASEAAGFLNQVMGLRLSAENITALETRTEGWIAGLQLAALALQGDLDPTGFIQSFTGSHRFVMDYLLEEVLHQQPDSVQRFLLHTSILDRLCGPLCDAVLQDASGQETLEYLEHANLFIVPLDNERRWYRYHHLFADLLRQRAAASIEDVADLHRRASVWYEANGQEIDAFLHAAAANDIERAACLLEGRGMPLHFRGAVMPVLAWLSSLPVAVLDARPSLWVMYASALSMTGQMDGVEEKLQAAEAALQGTDARNLIGHIAAIRALVAATRYQIDDIIAQSNRALEYLDPDNLPVRTATIWKLGIAYHLQGNRAAARRAYTEAIAISQTTGNTIINISAASGLGSIQAADTQLHEAAQTFQRILQLAGDPPPTAVSDAYLELAQIVYEWNDLDRAQQYGQQGIRLAQPLKNTDRYIPYQVFLARLKLAQGDVTDAAALLDEADQFARQHGFVHQIPKIVAASVRVLLQQGNLAAAANLVQAHDVPLSLARVYLAEGKSAAALAVLESLRQRAEANEWADDYLKVLVVEALALWEHGEPDRAVRRLGDALALAQPGGFIRLFVDEGPPMMHLLAEARGLMPEYTGMLLAACEQDSASQPLIEPLSQRELEILQLIAQGLSNRDISERLFLALSTVKGHNQRIFDKLQVQRRTEAVAYARELGLL